MIPAAGERPMRILYLCIDGIDLSGQSGGAIHIRSFVRALRETGHQVSLVCSVANSPAFLEADLRVRVFPALRTPWNHTLSHAIAAGNQFLGRPTRHNPDAVRVLHNHQFLKIAAEAARQLEPDFIYERYTLWGFAGHRLARARGVPQVLEVNAPLAYEQQKFRAGVTLPRAARWAERKIWRGADLVVAVSAPLARLLREAGVNPERVRVLPNTIDHRLFRADLDGEVVRERLCLNGHFVIGFVATFKRWHGADLLLEAFRDLHATDPSAHLLLVGDGPLRPVLEEEVRRDGLRGSVTFVGSLAHEEVPHYVAAMDVAVAPYPALEEFYYSPLKLFEYMAAGRPVVASRVGQVAEVMENGVNGLLFEPGDRAGLVACLRRLRQDPALRRELGRRASLACTGRSWTANVSKVVNWVEPLLDRGNLLAMSA